MNIYTNIYKDSSKTAIMPMATIVNPLSQSTSYLPMKLSTWLVSCQIYVLINLLFSYDTEDLVSQLFMHQSTSYFPMIERT